jgi:hypothetical protein
MFRDPMMAALILNYLLFGVAIGLLYYLLRRSGWTWQAGLGFSSVLGAGFFRVLANVPRPDILTYALFLVALCFVVGRSRSLAGLIWTLLVPMKFIAIVFLPAAVGADWLASRHGYKKLLRTYMPLAILTTIALGSIFAFNRLSSHAWMPPNHWKPTVEVLVGCAKSFIISIPRIFLFNWYGSVMLPFARIALPLCMILAVACLSSLRSTKEGRWFRIYAFLWMAGAALLLSVRAFDTSARLTGYALIVLILSFRPKQSANTLWLIYGFASLITGIVNATSVNSLGSNDPRYAELAHEFRSSYDGSSVIATNAEHILDLHANIPSIPVASLSEADHFRRTEFPDDEADVVGDDTLIFQKFFWVTLPSFDAVATMVKPVPHPGREWCEERRLNGGVLFVRCETNP